MIAGLRFKIIQCFDWYSGNILWLNIGCDSAFKFVFIYFFGWNLFDFQLLNFEIAWKFSNFLAIFLKLKIQCFLFSWFYCEWACYLWDFACILLVMWNDYFIYIWWIIINNNLSNKMRGSFDLFIKYIRLKHPYGEGARIKRMNLRD